MDRRSFLRGAALSAAVSPAALLAASNPTRAAPEVAGISVEAFNSALAKQVEDMMSHVSAQRAEIEASVVQIVKSAQRRREI